MQLWSLSDRCRLDNILQVGAWFTGEHEHEFYRIALSLRAFQSMSRGQYVASWNWSHALTTSLRLVGVWGTVLAHLEGRRAATPLDNVQIYLQNVVLLP